MKNLNAYLDRVHYPLTPDANLETLVGLHRAHTQFIPFENLDVIRKVPIVLDQEYFYKKIVERGRGGFCYEMNGLFKVVLDAVGYTSWFISCNVYVPPMDAYAADYGHVALVVQIDQKLYLADVGFGDAFMEPLRLDFEVPQWQYGICYRLSQLTDEEILLEKSADGEQYQKMFKFTLRPRELAEFGDMLVFHQTSPQAPFTRQPLCSLPTPEGRITLTGSSLTITRQGVRQEEAIHSEEEFDGKLKEYFGVVLEDCQPENQI